MKKLTFLLAAIAVLFMACEDKISQPQPQPTPSQYQIKTFTGIPLLGEVTYPGYDVDRARIKLLEIHQFFKDIFGAQGFGGCSAFRQGQFHVRNMDWYFFPHANTIIHMPADSATGRLASLGAALVTCGMVTQETLDAGVLCDSMRLPGGTYFHDVINTLPAMVTDGINECGVSVNVNVIAKEDSCRQGYKGTVADSLRPAWPMLMVSRFVLDYCHSVDEALQKLDTLNVTEIPNFTDDFHFMISDPEKTIVAEWYDGKFTPTIFTKVGTSNEYLCDGKVPAIMTNCYTCRMRDLINDPLYDTQYHSALGGLTKAGYNTLYNMHPLAIGVERYYYLADGDSANTPPLKDLTTDLPALKKQIETVLYSNVFTTDKNWLSEEAKNIWKNKNGMWEVSIGDSIGKEYSGAYDALYASRNSILAKLHRADYSLEEQLDTIVKGTGFSTDWYTSGTCIFDLQEKVIHFMPQEGFYSSKTSYGKYLTFRLTK